MNFFFFLVDLIKWKWEACLSCCLFFYWFYNLPSVIVMYPPFSQVVKRFQELFSQTKYKEAAELAAESPRGILRTPDTVAKFQVHFCV